MNKEAETNFASILDDDFDFVENEGPGHLMNWNDSMIVNTSITFNEKTPNFDTSIVHEQRPDSEKIVKFSVPGDEEEDNLKTQRNSAMRRHAKHSKKMSIFSPHNNSMDLNINRDVIDNQLDKNKSFEFTTAE